MSAPAAVLEGSATAPAPAQARLSLVPEGYAQKAMASLMQLHTELMDEKERRVDLHRQLMEKEQALAELKMYVKLLEEKVEPRTVQRPPRVRARPVPPPPPASARPKLSAVPRQAAPRPPRTAPRRSRTPRPRRSTAASGDPHGACRSPSLPREGSSAGCPS